MDYKEFRRHCVASRESKIFFQCGSTFELPLKFVLENPTDSDRFFYMMDICAIPSNRNPPKNFKGTVLVYENISNHPGYVKLKQGNSHFLRPRHLLSGGENGPARVLDQEFHIPPKLLFMLQRISPIWKQMKIMKVDESYSVYCPYWPPEAQEWLTRRRNNGWPDQELIARVKRGGCHFVSKSHPSNKQDNTQWRFSFSKAELILIHSWTPVQKQVYHFFRLAKNKLCNEISHTSLSRFAKNKVCTETSQTNLKTYHFKTVMLWACEQRPSEFWDERNIETCIRELIIDMIAMLSERRCLNYFISESNMLDIFGDDIDFEKEIKILKDCSRNPICVSSSAIIDVLRQSNSSTWLSNKLNQFLFLSVRVILFPLHEKLNGPLRSRIFSCECFLPEMKQLYDSINRNVRLMSIPSASERAESEDYKVIMSGYTAALNAPIDESRKVFEFNVTRLMEYSPYEILEPYALWPVLLREAYKDTSSHDECALHKSEDDIGFKEYAFLTSESNRGGFSVLKGFLRMILWYFSKRIASESSKQMSSPMYFMTASYLANFYYATMNDYEKTLRFCDEVYKMRSKIRKLYGYYIYFKANLPMVITTDWSAMFDEHIQTVLGFVMLYKALSPHNTTDDRKRVAFPLTPIRFLRYIEYQSTLKTDKTVPKVFAYSPDDNENANNSTRMTVCFSEVFLSAALRSSGVKILRVFSQNFDADFSFEEVIGRILCRIANFKNFEGEEIHQMVDRLNSATDSGDRLELHRTGLKLAKLEAEDLLFYFHFPSIDDVKLMHKKLRNGELKTLTEKDFTKLFNRTEMPLSASVDWFPRDYERCIEFFKHRYI